MCVYGRSDAEIDGPHGQIMARHLLPRALDVASLHNLAVVLTHGFQPTTNPSQAHRRFCIWYCVHIGEYLQDDFGNK
ncbi:hypothetical protein C8R48DRAFT_682539 [Suillus tomentosus]|nr:hypothetical protein C8R48DRAFT_682539 [Suillus tomentosus]